MICFSALDYRESLPRLEESLCDIHKRTKGTGAVLLVGTFRENISSPEEARVISEAREFAQETFGNRQQFPAFSGILSLRYCDTEITVGICLKWDQSGYPEALRPYIIPGHKHLGWIKRRASESFKIRFT